MLAQQGYRISTKLQSEYEPKTNICILRWPWCSKARAVDGFDTTEPDTTGTKTFVTLCGSTFGFLKTEQVES